MKRALVALLVPIVAVVACGGSVFEVSSSDGGTGGSDGGGDGGGDDGRKSGCPDGQPQGFTTCAPVGIQCEYGPNNGSCGNVVASCGGNGQWAYPNPPVGGPGCLAHDTCPASRSAIVIGADCGGEQLECNFPGQGRCTCAPQGFGGLPVGNPDGGPLPNVWACEQPQDGCPVTRPRLGTACDGSIPSCFYGDCNMPDSIAIECTNGVWVDAPYACAG